MNKIIGIPKAVTQDQIEVIDLLKETLAQALEGNISSIGIVACMKSGYATVMSGRQASDLHMGCASLQRKILDAVETAGEAKTRSSLHVPGRA